MKLEFQDVYRTNYNHYTRHMHWIESEPHSLASYLIMTRLELTDDEGKKYFQERVEQLDTDNDIGSICDIHTASLTKERPNYNDLDTEQAEELLDNADGEGSSLWSLTREMIRCLVQYGFCATETFKTSELSISAAQAQNERSYVRSYEPRHLVRWKRFTEIGPNKGKLKEVVFVNRLVTIGDKKHQIFKKYWLDDSSEFYYSQLLVAKDPGDYATLLAKPSIEVEAYNEAKQGGINTIPVVFFGNPDKGIKETSIYRPVYQSIILLNKQSMYDQTCRYSGSPRHIITGDDIKIGDAIALNNTHVGAIEGTGIDIKRFDVADPVAQWRDIQRLRTSIKRAGLYQPNQQLAPDSKEAPSVDSKRLDDETRKDKYGQIIDAVEAGVNELLAISSEFDGKERIPDTASAVFKRDFDMETAEEKQVREETLYKRSLQLGDAGHKIRKHIAINELQKTRFESTQDKTEEEIRAELIEAVEVEARNTGTSPTFQRLTERRAERQREAQA